jgi:hypothetical protein
MTITYRLNRVSQKYVWWFKLCDLTQESVLIKFCWYAETSRGTKSSNLQNLPQNGTFKPKRNCWIISEQIDELDKRYQQTIHTEGDRGIDWWRHFWSATPHGGQNQSVLGISKLIENLQTIGNGRGVSTDHWKETWVGLSNRDTVSAMQHHRVAISDSGLILTVTSANNSETVRDGPVLSAKR